MEEHELHCNLTQGPSFPLQASDHSTTLLNPQLHDLTDCNPDPVPPSSTPSSCFLPSEARKRSLGLKRAPHWRPQSFSSIKKPLAADGKQVNAVLAKVSRPLSTEACKPSVNESNETFQSPDIAELRPLQAVSDASFNLSQETVHTNFSLTPSSKFSISRFKPPCLATTPVISSLPSNSTSRPPLRNNNNLGNTQKSVCNEQVGTKIAAQEALPDPTAFYSVMYCMKKKNAKHKGPWFDGVLIARGSKCTLQDTEGKIVCKGNCFGNKNLAVDATTEISKYEVEVMRVASCEEYGSGTLFTGCFDTSLKTLSERIDKDCAKRQKFVAHSGFKENERKSNVLLSSRSSKAKSLASQIFQQITSKDALILNARYLSDDCAPVVVDPYLAAKLRPHQREGVQFMYECVMGLRSPLFTGCLLADEMGLGKTIQVIALIWTLIQQSSGQGNKCLSSFKHMIVVCPSSLVQNWGNEVKKWLGTERLKALVVYAGLPKEVEQKILDFKNGKTHPLLITSYELLRKHQDLLASSKPGLLVCDEAHRLKNSAGNKTISALLALNCPRRVLLTGTPVQNDLNEFYAMVDFANPNLLGPLSAFKRLYTEPIELSRDRDASDEQKQVGQARFLELQGRTKFYILRRTAAINKGYLPAKTEYLVFCRLQPLQVSLYETFVRSQFVTKLFLSETSAANVLTAIGVLRKLCNHPRLVLDDISKKGWESSLQHCNYTEDLACIRSDEGSSSTSSISTQYASSLSGKLDCLRALLSATFDNASTDLTGKVVVVSNFTQTLNFVQGLCEWKGWKWLRLDGATLVADRQKLVDRFNSGFGGERVFLLSSKAGGMGLNLVGANRLILFDPDWNPATDAQAMARIWREGQRKAVIIYRLFATGSIEEKIYQRQMVKGEIASTVEDNVECKNKSSGGRYFSREELRELFSLNKETQCDTYDLLLGRELRIDEQWRDCAMDVEDVALKEAIGSGVVTFVQRKMHAFEVPKEASCASL
ncbi:hypothetical protein GOP47_0021583 [Adiantum capillus-veneris]|uniref:DNA repair and recombination protein RAD54B n=1 Tax=Adiantum capillus-veneris TaxID=13818 RepID=A0A9D4U7Q6_ADICA|nr:hypothetical protein GOP47_0021583 [Adiantum capillus-veneris]